MTESLVFIEDVNNKPPSFIKPVFTRHLNSEPLVGEELLALQATDPDKNSSLKFSISKKLTLYDDIGNSTEIANIFGINDSSGSIFLYKPLPKAASMIIFSAMVDDSLGQTPGQSDTAQILFTFPMHSHFTKQQLPHSTFELVIPEEIELGTVILTLNENNVGSNEDKKLIFDKLPFSDPSNFFYVNRSTGAIAIAQRLDYDSSATPNKIILQINILSENKILQNSTIIIYVKDINDNYPVFNQKDYFISVFESDNGNGELLRVQATDKDEFPAFRTILYFLEGDGKECFVINKHTGVIIQKLGVVLDHEKKSSHELKVMAIDNPNDKTDQRTSFSTVHVEILDVNDNAPVFLQKSYSAVVQETSPLLHHVLTVKANDIDSGPNSEIQYSIINAKELKGLFDIHSMTGEMHINSSLVGRGRVDPYSLIVRAKDKGTPPKFADTEILISITSFPSQHEIPYFISPKSGEIIYISENTKVDSSIYQAELSTSHFTPFNKRVQYSLLDRGYGGSLENIFRINQDTGIITLKNQLDREKRETYEIIIAAETADLQTAFCVLNIIVTDENDNKPVFTRPKDSEPLQMYVNEECELGTVIGTVSAVDPDKGENAIINYQILGRNKNIPFSINQTHDSKGVVYVTDRLDYELRKSYKIIIKAKNPDDEEIFDESNFQYNKEDFTLLQVQININDIDDNPIHFTSPTSFFGVSSNSPQQFMITKLEAEDSDFSDNPIHYFAEKTLFMKESSVKTIPTENIFSIEKETGIVRIVQPLSSFDEGTFILNAVARSTKNPTSVAEKQLKIRILHKVDMLKFVFESSPPDVHVQLNHIHKDFASVLRESHPEAFQLAETQVMIREDNPNDNEVDTRSVSVCFQLIGNFALNLKQAQHFLDPNINPELKKFYESYNISNIDSCGMTHRRYKTTWVEILLITIIGSQIVIVLFGTFVICCWQRMRTAALQYPQYKAASECQSHQSKVRFQAKERK